MELPVAGLDGDGWGGGRIVRGSPLTASQPPSDAFPHPDISLASIRAIIVLSTPPADESASGSPDRAEGDGERVCDEEHISLHTLQRRLLICGTKQRHYMRVAEDIFSDLLQYCSLTSSNEEDVVRQPVTQCATLRRLSATTRRWQDAPIILPRRTEQTTGAPPSTDGEHFVVVSDDVMDHVVARRLGKELRGPMITVDPKVRWRMSGRVYRGDMPIVIFCGGTSGSGKSTTATLLASELSIPQILCTDTVRQLLRNHVPTGECMELFASTYEAFRSLSHRKDAGTAPPTNDDVIQGYEMQSDAILRVLDSILQSSVAKGRSVIVEGAHLRPSYMIAKQAEFAKQNVLCLPVFLYIKEASQHLKRFSVRAKSMSLQPTSNKYVSSFKYIRIIQGHLSRQAAALPIVSINNANVDNTLIVIHHSILHLLDRIARSGWPPNGDPLPLPAPVSVDEKKLLAHLLKRHDQRRAAAAGGAVPRDRPTDAAAPGPGAQPKPSTLSTNARARSALLLSAFQKSLVSGALARACPPPNSPMKGRGTEDGGQPHVALQSSADCLAATFPSTVSHSSANGGRPCPGSRLSMRLPGASQQMWTSTPLRGPRAHSYNATTSRKVVKGTEFAFWTQQIPEPVEAGSADDQSSIAESTG